MKSTKYLLDKILLRHTEYARQLVPKDKRASVMDAICKIFAELQQTLNGIYLLRELSRHSLDQVMSTGEMLSSLIISSLIEDSQLLDSRSFIKTDSNFGYANVDFTTDRYSYK